MNLLDIFRKKATDDPFLDPSEPRKGQTFYGKITVTPQDRKFGYSDEREVYGSSPAEVLDLLVLTAGEILNDARKLAKDNPELKKLIDKENGHYIYLVYPRMQFGSKADSDHNKMLGSGGSRDLRGIVLDVASTRASQLRSAFRSFDSRYRMIGNDIPEKVFKAYKHPKSDPIGRAIIASESFGLWKFTQQELMHDARFSAVVYCAIMNPLYAKFSAGQK